MLIITSDRLSNSRKPRRVTYQPETVQKNDRSMFDVLKEHTKKDEKRKRNLEHDFRDKLRNTASGWQYRYREG